MTTPYVFFNPPFGNFAARIAEQRRLAKAATFGMRPGDFSLPVHDEVVVTPTQLDAAKRFAERPDVAALFARFGDATRRVLAAANQPTTCPDCEGTGILAGFGFGTSENACDRPCSCAAAKRDDGPSEWTIIKQRRRSLSDPCYGEVVEIVAAKHDQQWTGCVAAYDSGTIVYDEKRGRGNKRVATACVHGERALDMAIARLLCGLRDGTVTP